MSEAIVQVRGDNKMLAFHRLDLDYSKSVTDSLGHPAGDALLKLIAERFTGILRLGTP